MTASPERSGHVGGQGGVELRGAPGSRGRALAGWNLSGRELHVECGPPTRRGGWAVRASPGGRPGQMVEGHVPQETFLLAASGGFCELKLCFHEEQSEDFLQQPVN